MTTTKMTLMLGLAALLATTPSRATTTVDFHFGPLTQTGAAAVGTAADSWNASDATNGGPVLLKDTAGAATTISATWTSADSWDVTRAIYSDAGGAPMDAATTGLMNSFVASYSYKPGATNLALHLAGLAHSQAYTLVLYGAGDIKNEGTIFTVTGAGTYTGATSGLDRKISNGPGVAYVVIPVVSSASGTLSVSTAKNLSPFAFCNGFQLVSQQASTPAPAPVAQTAAATPAPTTSTPAVSTTPMVWGVVGHPSWNDYASWIPANVTTQYNYLNQLGAGYYRVSFEGAWGPSYINTLEPMAQNAGITLLPMLPVHFVPANSAQTNYNNAYTVANSWATYAISQGYNLPYWEVGNEPENDGAVSITGDGSAASDFPDAVPGGFVSIINTYNGAYQGVLDAYTAGRKAGLTTITPKVMIGMCYRHWGLLAKMQAYDNGVLPCDMISWHWYGPNYGNFNGVITNPGAPDNGRTPAACLGDFKSKTNPTQPMDIWMTETNRSQYSNGVLLNGSVANNATPATSQDWAAEASAIQANVDSFKTVPSVKGVFVYELFDEPKNDSTSTEYLAEEGYFGLVTGLNGTLKNAFYTYQAEIKASKAASVQLAK